MCKVLPMLLGGSGGTIRFRKLTAVTKRCSLRSLFLSRDAAMNAAHISAVKASILVVIPPDEVASFFLSVAILDPSKTNLFVTG
nr:hypothetical protein Itr_chr03CG22280 [Ipomoea trifida]